MNAIRLKPLPSVEDLIHKYPLSTQGQNKIHQDRQEIREILEGKDKRLLMIVGPCSAWPNQAVLEYARRLAEVSKCVEQSLKIVMRMYIQKPRTIKGWTGPINHPNPFAESDIEAGMFYAREMMINVVEMGLPIADECLFTHNARGFSELVSWFAIGARSSEDHEHRIFASGADCPVGMKNPTHGSLEVAVNSVVAAQSSHVAAIDQYAVQTQGNQHAHLVLRGSHQSPNYSIEQLKIAKEHMDQHQIKNPAIVIDASHDNCLVNGKKNHRIQPNIIFDVMQNVQQHADLKKLIKGFMVESFLKEGNQKLEDYDQNTIDLDGLSITDPCMSWEDTETLLLQLNVLNK